MSPKVAKLWNLDINIYTKDHNPPHVHVTGPDVDVKIEIGTWKIVYAYGLKTKSLKKLLLFLKDLETDLMEAWNEIHNS